MKPETQQPTPDAIRVGSGALVRPLHCPACEDAIKYADEFDFNGDGPPPSYRVQCGSCGASGPYALGQRAGDHAGAIMKAVEYWNAMPRRSNK